MLLLIAVAAGCLPSAFALEAGATSRIAALIPAPRLGSVFKNLDPEYKRASYATRLYSFVMGGTWLVPERRVAALPAVAPDLQALRATRTGATVTWIGHSTLLVQTDGVNFLTDPTWSDRIGPMHGLVGVKRYTPPPIAIEKLPPIDFVLISHDHYDHLDEPTVRRLARLYNPRFVVPLGIKAWLADNGVSTNAVELDWGEAVTIKGLTITCAPAQHGSGRGVLDQGKRLWASWAVEGSKRFYFAGDSGYYKHFAEIGAALGPFDLAALPIGSYTPREIARPVHMSPEEALQAWMDLRARHFIGIHWGTYTLAREPYDQPPKVLAAEVARRGIDPEAIWIPRPGETIAW